MKIYLSHSSYYDYVNVLYNPIKNSELIKEHEIYFPHDCDPVNTKDIIGSFDLVICEVSFHSTGQGIEMGWADFMDVPILCIYKSGSKLSSAINLITNNYFEYSNENDLVIKLQNYFSNKA